MWFLRTHPLSSFLVDARQNAAKGPGGLTEGLALRLGTSTCNDMPGHGRDGAARSEWGAPARDGRCDVGSKRGTGTQK